MLQKTLFTIILLVGISPLYAQTLKGPSIDQIREKLALELPSYWKVDAFTIEASANYGTPVEPVFKNRFKATIRLTADTFVAAGQDGPFTFVRKVFKAGETRVANGISTSVFKAGAWQTEFELENNPTSDIGKPRDFFPGRVIVRGTKEEAEFYAQREAEEAQQHKLELARRARQMELEEMERKAELARKEFEGKLEEQKRKQKEKEQEAAKARVLELQNKLESGIKKELLMQIPGYWSIVTFSTDVARNIGTVSEPVIKHRFTAEVQLKTDTFAEAEKKGPPVFLTPVMIAGEKRLIHGISTARLSNVTWKISLHLENGSVLKESGQPRDYFAGKVIVKGSPEEEEYFQRVEAEAERKHKEELLSRARQEELKEQERKAELARIAHEAKVREEKHKAELASLTLEAQMRDEKQKQRENEEARIKARREQKLANLEAALAGSDVNKRKVAIRMALESGDAGLQQRALAFIFSQSKIFSAVYGKDKKHSFSLKIVKFDPHTGDIEGEFVGDYKVFGYRKAKRFVGKLSSTNLGVSNDDCSLSVTLRHGTVMEGSLKSLHFGGNTKFASVTIF